MKKEATNQTNTETNVNPFVFENGTVENGVRKLDHTSALIGLANTRATDLMKSVSTDRTDLIDLANRMMDNGDRDDLVQLIKSVYDDGQIATDATEALTGADDNELDKLLESRRSDRSKAKNKGIKSNVSVCKTYISAMYAELMIRSMTGKPLSDSNKSVDIDYDALGADMDALTKKVKSLQTKKCRLTKLANYDQTAREELQKTNEEIARLNALRPSTRSTSKTAVKSISVDTLRDALSKLDASQVPEEVLELMKKLG